MNFVIQLLKSISKKVYIYVGIGILILLVGFIMGFKCNKPNKPQIINTTITKIDSIIIHDTTMIEKPVIKYKEKIVTQYKKDTAKVLVAIKDTSRCFTVEGTSERGTYVQTEVCSKDFPSYVPIDITSNIVIKEAPDTIKTINTKDIVIYKTPWYKDRKNYIIVGLTATIIGLITLR
jgi:hypothetical protein